MSTTHEIVLTPVTTKVRFYTSVDNGSYIPSHWHRAIEIIYIQTGALTVTVESHAQKLTAGQCILINSNVVHSTQCTIPNTAIVFQIPLDFIETYIPQVRSLLFHLPEGSADQRNVPSWIFSKTRWKRCRSPMICSRMVFYCVLTVCCLKCCSSFITASAQKSCIPISVKRKKNWIV